MRCWTVEKTTHSLGQVPSTFFASLIVRLISVATQALWVQKTSRLFSHSPQIELGNFSWISFTFSSSLLLASVFALVSHKSSTCVMWKVLLSSDLQTMSKILTSFCFAFDIESCELSLFFWIFFTFLFLANIFISALDILFSFTVFESSVTSPPNLQLFSKANKQQSGRLLDKHLHPKGTTRPESRRASARRSCCRGWNTRGEWQSLDVKHLREKITRWTF